MIYRFLDGWIRLSARIGVLGLVLLSITIAVDVLLRWLFAAPVYGAADIYRLLVICSIAAFFPLVILKRQNVEIHLLGRVTGARLTRIVDTFAHCCTLLFLLTVVWQCGRHALRVSDQETPILGIPVAPVWWFAIGLLSSSVPAQLIVMLEHSRPPGRGD